MRGHARRNSKDDFGSAREPGAGAVTHGEEAKLELGRPDASHAVAQVARALMEKTGYMDLVATAPPRNASELAYLM